jgi:uncharacterized caspase-like protein
MRKPSFLAVLFFVLLAFAPTEAFAERRVALVVGNSQYKKIPRLANPLNDASDIAEALRKLGFDVIIRTDADKGNFDRALAEFARKASGADAALFYYAGHGIQYQRQNYLLPTDIEVEDYNDVEFQSVSISRVLDALHRSDGVKIIILDACRDNPLDKRLSASSRALGETRGGLARLDRTDGLVIAYATAPDQVAQDGATRNSPFTAALIRWLSEPGLEIGTLFRRVSQDVYEQTGGRQRPEISISLIKDFYLNLNDSDTTTWAKIRDSQDPAEFYGFVKSFPQSPLAREARSRIEFIERVRRENEERFERERRSIAAQFEQFRQEAARQEVERLAAEKRDAARREAERVAQARRLEEDRADAARRERELAAQRQKEQDDLAASQRTEEARRREEARLAAEKLAADNRERELAARRKQEADRQEAARLAAEKLMAEKQAAEQAAKRKQEDERRAEEAAAAQREALRQEVARLAVERRLAEKAEKRKAEVRQPEPVVASRQAPPAAESERKPEQIAMLGGPDALSSQNADDLRRAVEKLAEERRKEAKLVEEETKERERLMIARQTATGAELERIDVAIRELDRRAVERLAKKARENRLATGQ